MSQDLVQVIAEKKQGLNAVIMAHFYQLPEIQDVADFVGDSLQLAKQAAETDAQVIVFCGVGFMAESAKILNPHKTVILPDIQAGCPMADMADANALREMKQQHPDAVVVSYVNTSAEVKAESYICCTSANAVQVVNSIPENKEIIFVPDKNLGAFIESQTGRKMILWEGCCPVHDALTSSQLEEQMRIHPGVKVAVHPECPPEITRMADVVRSTAGILEYVRHSPEQEFIIGTEEGFLYTLQKACPKKKFYLARAGFRCPDMKYITLNKLNEALNHIQYQTEVREDIRSKAYQALERMLTIK
ncbi:MAG TPA: quinolinate synthase NadA [Syntrophomonadaceae bacterium]|nr:quinolinate synthase NadA [Syntrophomonadaceae bacterium]HNX28836.1 quinolinate synthase NadA [Syntrophomonadaceae bacterium]HPR93296.1 quinolinate synthase NadA [Syntrophomonadaceae bacterium]